MSDVETGDRNWTTAFLDNPAVVLIGAAAASFVLVAAGNWLYFEAAGAATFWPSTGFFTAVFVCLTARVRPYLLFGQLLGNLVHDYALTDFDPAAALGFASAGLIEVLIAGFIILRFSTPRPAMDKVQDVLAIGVAAAVAGPAAGAIIGAGVLKSIGAPGSYGLLWQVWWAAGATGLLVLTPLLMSLKNATRPLLSGMRPSRIAEAAVALTATLALTQFAFGTHAVSRWLIEMPYAVFPLLIWVALRFSPRIVTLTIACVAVIVLVNLKLGHGPFFRPDAPLQATVVAVQTFLVTLALSALLLAALTRERSTATHDLGLSTDRLRQVMQRAKIRFWTNKAGSDITTFDYEPELPPLVSPTGAGGETLAEHLTRVLPDDRKLVTDTYETADALHSEFDIEYRTRRPDGRVLHIREIGIPQFGADGEFLGHTGTIQDVTDLRRAEENLILSETRLRAIIDNSPDTIYLKTTDCRYVLANAAFRKTYLSSGQSVEGKTLEDLLEGPIVEASRDHDETVLRLGRPIERRGTWTNIHGERVITSLRFPVRDATGVITGIAGIDRDITERHEAEVEVEQSRATLVSALETSPAGIIIASAPEGMIEVFNRAARTIYRSGHRAIVGQKLADLGGRFVFRDKAGHEIDSAALPLARALTRGETSSDEVFEVASEGDENRWLSANAAPILGPGGKQLGAITVFVDITETRKAEKEIAAARVQLDNIIANMPGSVFQRVLHPDGHYELPFVGPRHEEFYGVSPEDLMSGRKSVADRVHPDDIDGWIAAMEASARNLTTLDHPLRVKRPDGAYGWMHAVAKPRRGNDGEIIWDGVTIDVTAQREAEIALRERDERLYELQSELLRTTRASTMGQLSSAIAHEINQPLAAIVNYLQAASHLIGSNDKTAAGPGKAGNAKVGEIVSKAAGQAERAGEIISRLRNFFQRGELKRDWADLGELISDAVVLAMLGEDADDIDVGIDIAPDVPQVYVDRIQIQQVLINLVRNAAAAMQGPGAKRLRINAVAIEGDVEIGVTDSGPGITPELAERLFEPFTTTRAEGIGMGLSISHSIIEAHGGRIWVEQADGGGAVMKFRIPAGSSKTSKT